MSTLKVNTLQNTSGVEVYTAKAWVNFNGTGTVAIRASGNVSSITDVSAGTYRVNFINTMPDANYAVNASNNRTVSWADGGINVAEYATTSVVVQNVEATAATDTPIFSVSVFR
jgi:hypothetical protein